MKRILLFVLAIFNSVTLAAAEVPTSEIAYIAPWPTHIDIRMDTPYIDPENCGDGSGGQQYRIDLINDTGAQAKLSTLLSAFMAGKAVGLSINGCVAASPKIEGVRLYK